MRCDACPLAPGRECHGEAAIPHLCGFAASGDPGKVMLARDRNDFPAPGPPPPATTGPVLESAPPTPAIQEQIDCIKRARACEHRVTDGSCQRATCKLGKGHLGTVYLSDCTACIKERR